MLRLLLPIVAALSCVACHSFPGHPVRLSAPRLAADTVLPEPAADSDPTSAPDATAGPALLFMGLEGVLQRVNQLRGVALLPGRAPRFVALPAVAASVKRRYARGAYGGPVRIAVVRGAVGRVPLSPKAMADLMMDPEVERQVLGAQTFRRTQVIFDIPGARREQCRAELLNVGLGPIRFNLRFNVVIERYDAPDGRVWLRYDPSAVPRNERVTLYRGGAVLEPDPAGGTRVSELIIMGTDIQVAPPFEPPLLKMATDTLENRATNLWIRAWRGVPAR